MGTDTRKPLNATLLLASEILLFTLIIPAFIPRPAQVVAFAVLGWYFYQVISTQTSGYFMPDYALGSALLSQYMAALECALLTSPDAWRDFHDNDQTSVAQRPFKKRLMWTLELCSNPRCIGQAHEPSFLPPHWPSLSSPRSRFILSRVFLATCCFAIAGGTGAFYAVYANMSTADKLVTGAPFHWRVLLVPSFGLSAVCMLSGVNAALSAGIVGCGFSSPERWPLLFDSPLQAWSIQRFWRRFWHQMIRRYALGYTSLILGCFFPRSYVGSMGYKLARLYSVFCISGIVHLSGDVMSSGKLGFDSFTFFMLQPFGITIEIVISYLWRRLQRDDSNPQTTRVNGGTAVQQKRHNGRISNANGKSLPEQTPPMWIRCVGLVWVTLWMVWTGAYMADAVLSGFGRKALIEFQT